MTMKLFPSRESICGLVLLGVFAVLTASAVEPAARLRVVISTDLPPTNVVMRGAPPEQCSDLDDMQSIVRLTEHWANEVEFVFE